MSTTRVLGVFIVLIGGLLIYSAIKDVSPLEVVKAALTGQPAPTKK